MLTIASMVFVLGVLIFVHELGHFMAAKSVGIGVPRFSIGLGPITPLRFQRGETEYVISWIPFGGYVKMATNEDSDGVSAVEGGDVAEDYPSDKLFESKSVAARILVISAGVIMNALFAVVVYSVMAFLLGRAIDPTTRIAAIARDSLPEEAQALADVPFGTRVIAVNGDTVNSWNDIMAGIGTPSQSLDLEFDGNVGHVVIPVPAFEDAKRAAIMRALKPLREPVIGIVSPGTPAAGAGLEPMDKILFIGSDTVAYMDRMIELVEARAGDELTMVVQRGDEVFTLSITPDSIEVSDPITGDERMVGRIGITFHVVPIRVTYGAFASLGQGARLAVSDAATVLFALKGFVTGQLSPRELGGPIAIGQISGQMARAGFESLLLFMAFLSVNLAILNLLPIPVLDGGHLVFLLVEAVRRKPLSLNVRMKLSQVGLVVLLGLMAMAVTNDIFRIFS